MAALTPSSTYRAIYVEDFNASGAYAHTHGNTPPDT